MIHNGCGKESQESKNLQVIKYRNYRIKVPKNCNMIATDEVAMANWKQTLFHQGSRVTTVQGLINEMINHSNLAGTLPLLVVVDTDTSDHKPASLSHSNGLTTDSWCHESYPGATTTDDSGSKY